MVPKITPVVSAVCIRAWQGVSADLASRLSFCNPDAAQDGFHRVRVAGSEGQGGPFKRYESSPPSEGMVSTPVSAGSLVDLALPGPFQNVSSEQARVRAATGRVASCGHDGSL